MARKRLSFCSLQQFGYWSKCLSVFLALFLVAFVQLRTMPRSKKRGIVKRVVEWEKKTKKRRKKSSTWAYYPLGWCVRALYETLLKRIATKTRGFAVLTLSLSLSLSLLLLSLSPVLSTRKPNTELPARTLHPHFSTSSKFPSQLLLKLQEIVLTIWNSHFFLSR